MRSRYREGVPAALKIGEVARRTGLSVRTLRHYDALGLLVPSGRTYGDHRLYTSHDVRRLLAVQHLKSLGLSLAEVRSALDDPGFDAAQALEQHIALVERRLAAEQELLARLRTLQGAAGTGWDEVLSVIALTESLNHREPAVRLRAALDAPTAAPLPVLVGNLATEAEPGVQDVLAWAVVQHGADAVPLVLEHLADASPAVRARMALVLGKLADPRPVPALVPLLNDADPEVASAAAFALGRIGGPAALTALLHHLGTGSGARRDSVGDAVARFGDLAVSPLTRALQDANPGIRRHAATVLGQIARPEAAPALSVALGDPDADVRLAALVALSDLPGETAEAAITAAGNCDDPRLRALAQRVRSRRTPPGAARTR